MKYIQLTQGKQTKVDNDDFDELNRLKWTFSKGYAAKKLPGNKNLFLHSLITRCPPNKKVDHINGNGLDNRRSNLRICTQQQNTFNQKLSKSNKSGYKGVCYFPYGKRIKKWVAKININGKQKHLGYFATKIEGAREYNKAAIKYFGVYANLNKLC